MLRRVLLVGLPLLVVAVSGTAPRASECEGRCEDGFGSVMTVSGGACDPATETCRAGCDASVPGRPRPYAECVSRASGEPVARRGVVVPQPGHRE